MNLGNHQEQRQLLPHSRCLLPLVSFCTAKQCFCSLVITQAPKGITQSSGEVRHLQPPHSRDLTGPASKGNQASLASKFLAERLMAQPSFWIGSRSWVPTPGFISRGHGGIDSGRETWPQRPTLWEGTRLGEKEQGLESPHPHPHVSMAISLHLAQSRLQGEALCSSCFVPLVIQV